MGKLLLWKLLVTWVMIIMLSYKSIIVASFCRVHHLSRRCSRFTWNKTALFSSCGDEKEHAVVDVSIETANNTKVISVRKGEVLRSAMLKRGASPHNGRARLINCRGLGTCGTCAVEIDWSGNKSALEPSERNTKEKLRLNFPPHGSSDQSPSLRLACQVQVMGNGVKVIKRSGFWGQDSVDLAQEFEPQLYFGELEYILDNKSPKNK